MAPVDAMITLYDLYSTLDETKPSTSPFVWRTRFALQLKGLPFETRLLGYDEISGVAKEVGACPTATNADGTPQYTVPMIYDSATNTAVADSFLIAKYLDQTYPDSGPTFLPAGTDVLQKIFASDVSMEFIRALYPYLITISYAKLSPKMQKQYRGRIPLDPTAKFDEKTVAEMWNETESRLGKLDSAMGDKDTFGQAGEFTFADTALGASLQCVRQALGADSQQWETVKAWHNSRWGRYLDRLEKAA